MEATHNTNLLENFTAYIFNDTIRRDPRLNISVTTLTEFQKILLYIEVTGKSDERRRDYDRMLFKGEIDSCKASKGIIGNFLTKLMIDTISNYSNFRFTCPLEKKVFYVNSFPLPTEKDLPIFLIPLRGKFLCTVRLKVKLGKGKSLVPLITLNVYGDHI